MDAKINIGVKAGNSLTKAVRISLDAGCLAFPSVFLVLTAIVENSQVGYDRINQTVSELVWGELGWIETILFVCFGILLLGLATRFKSLTPFMRVCGIAFIVLAIFPIGKHADGLMVSSKIHETAAITASALLPVLCFLFAADIRKTPIFYEIRDASIIAGILGLALNLLGLICLLFDVSWFGLIERIIILNGLGWLQLIGIYIWKTNRRFIIGTKSIPPVIRGDAVRIPVDNRTNPNDIHR